MKENLNDLRVNYNKFELNEEDLSNDPFDLFKNWFEIARQEKEILEPNAMILATVNENSQPSARVVLLKEYNSEGFVFFTNYNSKKGRELVQNPNASILFFWESLFRQIRIEGVASKVSREETELYFNSRPYESRIGAIASNQSSMLDSRNTLEKKYSELQEMYPDNPSCPENWGGFILKPEYFEFWQGRQSRLHDRVIYKLKEKVWEIGRLYP